ncbi:MAG: aldo/keto reductase [Acidobacteriota bacterium]|nr:MAG: aldo/keto reductase [Acidobacteriota bacterium]
MKYRSLGRTGWNVSEISFGAWAIGGDWGEVPESDALAALHAAADEGINFIDTADVYGDGRSERIIARFLKERSEEIIVATKAGRRLDPHTAAGYNRENLTRFVERSLRNLETDALDLVQLHCPPTDVYYQPEVFSALDGLVEAGKIRHYGVSVEKVEEAIKALQFPGIQSVQIIFNIFRQRPAELFFGLAQKKKVGILARVPLASGLLSGRMSRETQFPADDHRNYNRAGQAFDVGETFSGVPYELGLDAVEQLRDLVGENSTLVQFALRWILMFDAVTCTIPSSKNPSQAQQNARAVDLPPLSGEAMSGVRAIYDRLIRDAVHQRW